MWGERCKFKALYSPTTQKDHLVIKAGRSESISIWFDVAVIGSLLGNSLPYLDVKSYHWKCLGGHNIIRVLWGLTRFPCEMVREKMWNRSLFEDFPKIGLRFCETYKLIIHDEKRKAFPLGVQIFHQTLLKTNQTLFRHEFNHSLFTFDNISIT